VESCVSRSLRSPRPSCFSLKKVSPGLFRFDTIFTVLAAVILQRLNDLAMPLNDVWITQNVGCVGI
jgi:hypothetical protein